ncbi:MAG: hypothetical protein ACK5IP_22345 [Paracoccus sp. (in: a-proteobacteria)]
MDSAEQAAGEKRVRRLLIEPLERRGLMRTAGMKVDAFEAMQAGLCAKLAYMSDLNLRALEEESALLAGGPNRDRFPVGQRILECAGRIEPPGDDASPLIRAVFANQLGDDAIAGGWAPELLRELRHSRRWPLSFVVKTIKADADDDLRRMRGLEARLARGDVLDAADAEWRSRRLAALDRCRRIADLSRAEGGAA